MLFKILPNNLRFLYLLCIDDLLIQRDLQITTLYNLLVNKLAPIDFPQSDIGMRPEIYPDVFATIQESFKTLASTIVSDGDKLRKGLLDSNSTTDIEVELPKAEVVKQAQLLLQNLGFIPQDNKANKDLLTEIENIFNAYLAICRKISIFVMLFRSIGDLPDSGSYKLVGYSALSTIYNKYGFKELGRDISGYHLHIFDELFYYVNQGNAYNVITEIEPKGVSLERITHIIQSPSTNNTINLPQDNENKYYFGYVVAIYHPTNKDISYGSYEYYYDFQDTSFRIEFNDILAVPQNPITVDYVIIKKPNRFKKFIYTGFLNYSFDFKISFDQNKCYSCNSFKFSQVLPKQMVYFAVLNIKYKEVPKEDNYHRLGDDVPSELIKSLYYSLSNRNRLVLSLELSPYAFDYISPNESLVSNNRDYFNFTEKPVLGFEFKNGIQYFLEFPRSTISALEVCCRINKSLKDLIAYYTEDGNIVIESRNNEPFRVLSPEEGSPATEVLGFQPTLFEGEYTFTVSLLAQPKDLFDYMKTYEAICDMYKHVSLNTSHIKLPSPHYFTLINKQFIEPNQKITFSVNSDRVVPCGLTISNIDVMQNYNINGKNLNIMDLTCCDSVVYGSNIIKSFYSSKSSIEYEDLENVFGISSPYWIGLNFWSLNIINAGDKYWNNLDVSMIFTGIEILPVKKKVSIYADYNKLAPSPVFNKSITCKFTQTVIYQHANTLVFVHRVNNQTNFYYISFPEGKHTPQSLYQFLRGGLFSFDASIAKLIGNNLTDIYGNITPIKFKSTNDSVTFYVDSGKLWISSIDRGSTANIAFGLPVNGCLGGIYDSPVPILVYDMEFVWLDFSNEEPLKGGKVYARSSLNTLTFEISETKTPCAESCYQVKLMKGSNLDCIADLYNDTCVPTVLERFYVNCDYKVVSTVAIEPDTNETRIMPAYFEPNPEILDKENDYFCSFPFKIEPSKPEVSIPEIILSLTPSTSTGSPVKTPEEIEQDVKDFNKGLKPLLSSTSPITPCVAPMKFPKIKDCQNMFLTPKSKEICKDSYKERPTPPHLIDLENCEIIVNDILTNPVISELNKTNIPITGGDLMVIDPKSTPEQELKKLVNLTPDIDKELLNNLVDTNPNLKTGLLQLLPDLNPDIDTESLKKLIDTNPEVEMAVLKLLPNLTPDIEENPFKKLIDINSAIKKKLEDKVNQGSKVIVGKKLPDEAIASINVNIPHKIEYIYTCSDKYIVVLKVSDSKLALIMPLSFCLKQSGGLTIVTNKNTYSFTLENIYTRDEAFELIKTQLYGLDVNIDDGVLNIKPLDEDEIILDFYGSYKDMFDTYEYEKIDKPIQVSVGKILFS